MKTTTATPSFVEAVQKLAAEYANNSLDLKAKAEAYALAHFVEEISKNRRESLRETLMAEADANGEENAKGGKKLLVEDYTVLKEKRTASAPDEKKLVALLEKKGLPVEAAFDRVTTLQANPSKVNELVANGHLTDAEARDLYKVTFALVVHASEGFDALVEGVCPAGVIPSKKRR